MYKYLIINHIPRCGGSSLRKSFYEASKNNNYFNQYPIYIAGYTHEDVCLFDDPYLVKAIHKHTLLYFDHSPHLYIEKTFGIDTKDSYKILTLRNPVDRFVSHIHYFQKIHINNLSKETIERYISRFGHCTIQQLTNFTHKDKSLKQRLIISQSVIKEYQFIFQLEDQKLSEIFTDNNPFGLRLPNFHINRSSIDQEIKISQYVKNIIYKNMPLEIKLLENYYEMDL